MPSVLGLVVKKAVVTGVEVYDNDYKVRQELGVHDGTNVRSLGVPTNVISTDGVGQPILYKKSRSWGQR